MDISSIVIKSLDLVGNRDRQYAFPGNSDFQYQIGTPEGTEHCDLVALSLLSKNVYQWLMLSHKRSLPTV